MLCKITGPLPVSICIWTVPLHGRPALRTRCGTRCAPVGWRPACCCRLRGRLPPTWARPQHRRRRLRRAGRRGLADRRAWLGHAGGRPGAAGPRPPPRRAARPACRATTCARGRRMSRPFPAGLARRRPPGARRSTGRGPRLPRPARPPRAAPGPGRLPGPRPRRAGHPGPDRRLRRFHPGARPCSARCCAPAARRRSRWRPVGLGIHRDAAAAPGLAVDPLPVDSHGAVISQLGRAAPCC